MDEEQVISEAKALGWVPKEDFRGDPEKWIEASEFLERGQTQLPILRQNNRKLQDDVHKLSGELTELKSLFSASQESLVELKKFHAETFNARIEAEKKRLREEIKGARDEGDLDAELKAQEDLTKLNSQVKRVETQAAKPTPQPSAVEESPDTKAWREANPWFDQDEGKRAQVMGIAQLVRAKNPGVVGKAYFSLLDAKIQELMPDAPPVGKVEGTRGGSSSPSNSRSFSSLPADAKAVCERQAKNFVGKGRAFTSMAEWQKHYADVYFEGVSQ